MCPLRITYDRKASTFSYLVKTIRVRRGQDFWNSYLAAATKYPHPEGHDDPLAHLKLRIRPREADTAITYGMLYTPPASADSEPQYTWAQRPLIATPDPVLRLVKPVSQQISMFPYDLKASYSSPQSTTYVNLALNIRPRLFSGLSDPYAEPLCGVFFPFTHFFALLNRMLAYDGGTLDRPYDRPPFPYIHSLTFDQLMREERFKGPRAPYTELLARLRTFNPDIGDGESLAYIKPGLFVCDNPNKKILLHALLMTLRRAFDLIFCLIRKFPAYRREAIPLLLYKFDAEPPSQCFCGPWMFNGEDNIDIIIREFLGEERVIDPEFQDLYAQIMFQQGLWKAITRDPPRPLDSTREFDSFLRAAPPAGTDSKSTLLYLETLRAFVTFFEGRPEIADFHEYFRNLISKFTSGTSLQKDFRYARYGFRADFKNPVYPQATKIHPLHSFDFSVNHIMDGKLPLIEAIKNNDLEKFQALVASPKIKVNKRAALYNAAALHWAVELQRVEMVRTLLAHPDIDPNITSDRIGPPIHVAIVSNNEDIFNQLLEHPRINPNAEDVNEITPLIQTIKSDNIRMFNKLLLDPRLEINQTKKNGDTILMILLLALYTPRVRQYLLGILGHRNINVNAINEVRGYSALTLITNPIIFNAAKMELLLSHPNIDVNLQVRRNTALMCGASDVIIVRRLLQVPNIDVTVQNEYGATAFDYGTEITRKLILAYKGEHNIPFTKDELEYLKNDVKPNCEICGKPLRKFFRHHCRRCIKAICSSCSRKIRDNIYCITCVPLIGP